jgi:hypothetical protein
MVGGDDTQVWSTKLTQYVPTTDAAYQLWLEMFVPETFSTELALSRYLGGCGLIGPVVPPEHVDAERDRRVAAGFTFNGKLFQSGPTDQKRINGAVTMALIAISNGAQAGNLLWANGSTPFYWIAADNSEVQMDAQTAVQFGVVAGKWEGDHIYAARALKDMNPIPRDFADNQYWPANG